MKLKYFVRSLETTEWLNNRGIGGSDLAAIMGEGKWGTIDDIYTRVARKKVKIEKPSSRMLEGTLAEDHIRKLFILEHKEYKVEEPPLNEHWLFTRNDYEEITLTPDALLDNRTGALEIKDVEIRSKKEYEMWSSGIIPAQYLYQLYQYFIVINSLKFAILHARFKIFRFNETTNKQELDKIEERDYLMRKEDYIKDIKNAEKIEIKLIDNYIRKGIRPPSNYLKVIGDKNV